MEENISFLEEVSQNTPIVVDANNWFLNEYKEESLVYLFVADAVICESSFAQQMVYEATGRLATIVTPPFNDKAITDPCTYTNNIEPQLVGWLGDVSSMFNVLHIINKNKNINFSLCGSGLKTFDKKAYDNIRTVYNSRSKKDVNKFFNEVNFVYLPKVFNPNLEIQRLVLFTFLTFEGKLAVLEEIPEDIKAFIQDKNFLKDLEEDSKKSLSDLTAKYADLQKVSEKVKQRQVLLKKFHTETHKPALFLENMLDEMLLEFDEEKNNDRKVNINVV